MVMFFVRDELFWSTQIFQNKSQIVLLEGKIKKMDRTYFYAEAP